MHGSAIYNIGGGVRLDDGLCVCVCVHIVFKRPYCNRKLRLFTANVAHTGRALFEILLRTSGSTPKQYLL